MINNKDLVVEEMLAGYLKAHPSYVKVLEENSRAIVKAQIEKKNKVGILIGGGSGHEPGFLGYVGHGMADGVAVGNIFASPPPAPILEVTKAIHTGAGVVYIYGNYAGDIMNFGMAAEMADFEDIPVEMIIGRDDVASAPEENKDNRRGIAGEFLIIKVAGAAAEKDYTLDEVVRVTNKANSQIYSMGVGLTPCSLPQTGEPSFEIGANEMEIGLGHHGEPGVRKAPLASADEIVDELLNTILENAHLEKEDEVVVLVNGLGSTTRMELYIMYNHVEERLNELGIKIYKNYIGDYITSLEMGGASITLLKVDSELKELIDYPADCPMFVQK